MKSIKLFVNGLSGAWSGVNLSLRLASDSTIVPIAANADINAVNQEFVYNSNVNALNGVFSQLIIDMPTATTGTIDFDLLQNTTEEPSFLTVSAFTATFDNATQFVLDLTKTAFEVVLADPEPTDKIRLSDLQLKLRLGQFISDDDSVFLALGGNTLLAEQVMQSLDAGNGFTGLKQLGLTDSTAYKVLSIYNVKLDTVKYESEKALELVATDFNKLLSLQTYLTSQSITMPSLDTYIAVLRSDHTIYSAVRTWQQTLTP